MNMRGSQELSMPVFALRLRALVVALGECACPPWWKTEFMNETGFRFLERLYPRSYFRAAVHAAGQAACEIHDRAVGRLGVYHLFRLPELLEVEMYHVSSSTDEEFVSEFRLGLGDATRLLNILSTMCGTALGTEIGFGARRIGTALDLAKSDAFGKPAAVYFNAFSQGEPGFPYFVTEP
ncbi:MAG: BrxE family protein [Desulfomonilaceae bacterium]